MKKYKILTILALFGVAVACDDEGSPKGTGSDFETLQTGYYEEDGDVDVLIPFRNPKSMSLSDIVISGSATEDEDFVVNSVTNEGISITLMDDDKAELDESISFQISGSPGNSVHTVKFVSDDPGFMTVVLDWDDAVDLDLISWYYDEVAEEFVDIDFSDPGNTLDPIDWSDPDGTYGFTYNYYDGDVEPLDFSVTFTPTGVTLEGETDPLTFNATYSLDNVDPNNVQIEQIVTKEGSAFFDFSDIEVPGTGSKKAKLVEKLREAAAKRRLERGK